MNSTALQQVNLSGGVDANATATWGRNMSRLAAKADAALHGGMAPERNPAQDLPLDGVIHARYAGASKMLTLSQSYVRLPQTSLDMNGTISDRSALQLRLIANDLHELETISNIFQKPSSGQPAKPLGLYGVASFNGSVRGSTAAPELTGLLQASNLKIKGSAWRVLRTNVLASPSLARLENGELAPAGQGRIKFNVRCGSRQWAFTSASFG